MGGRFTLSDDSHGTEHIGLNYSNKSAWSALGIQGGELEYVPPHAAVFMTNHLVWLTRR